MEDLASYELIANLSRGLIAIIIFRYFFGGEKNNKNEMSYSQTLLQPLITMVLG